MKLLRKFCFTLAISAALVTDAFAQQVPKNVIAEHFTNTLCSICASRNPGLHTNLANYPQVIHVSIHPSSPYTGCTLSMANVSENDARTNFYGLYGSTPQLTVQGRIVTSTFTDSSIFTSKLGQTTSFSMNAVVTLAGTDSIRTTVTIKKTDTSSLTSLQFYGLVAEDTLFFTSGNGESRHYDVFRKSLAGNTPISITSLVNIGDYVVITRTLAINAAWNRNRIYSIAILQDLSKNVLQAAKSNKLPYSSTVINNITEGSNASVYPNPAGNELFIDGLLNYPVLVTITDINGMTVVKQTITQKGQAININGLDAGLYLYHLGDATRQTSGKFLKK